MRGSKTRTATLATNSDAFAAANALRELHSPQHTNKKNKKKKKKIIKKKIKKKAEMRKKMTAAAMQRHFLVAPRPVRALIHFFSLFFFFFFFFPPISRSTTLQNKEILQRATCRDRGTYQTNESLKTRKKIFVVFSILRVLF